MPKVHVKIFISYAHKDEQAFAVFKPAIKEELDKSTFFSFDAWEDSGIPVGAKWHDYIQKKLKKCRIAILCVSDNFFASEYIKESEFKELINEYGRVLIVPVYFADCKINTWENLAAIQFFKPKGALYGMPETMDFSFSDLVTAASLSQPDKEKYVSSYCSDLSLHLQQSYIAANLDEDESRLKKVKFSDKAVEYLIIAAIAISLIFIVHTFALNKTLDEDAQKFKGAVWGAMFFGSSGLFMVNRKFQHN